MGLAGSGKSAIFREAARLLGATSYCEPEEDAWGDAVTKRDEVGQFTGVHWFRAIRVPNLIAARSAANAGAIVLFDSFYDKLCSHYLGKPGMEWLLAPSDVYFANFLQTAQLDLEHLPDADAVVAFSVSEQDWRRMLGSRRRELDASTELVETFHTQKYFLDAARDYCKSKNIRLVEFKNEYSTLGGEAKKLVELLRRDGVLDV